MNSIVIGLGFGDEGKGLVTDYLAAKSFQCPVVVRFSGGHQAGHTVVSKGFRHIFTNFGSGSFRGVPTYWSRFCTVEPVGFLRERELLIKKVNPQIYIHGKCPVTTPYDIAFNRERDQRLGHGSVGVGFGATIAREEACCSFLFEDLLHPSVLKMKLKMVQAFYPEQRPWEDDFIEACRKIIDCASLTYENPYTYRDHIYEGAQGLLLDQHYGFFPHVTRGNTGTKNALELEPRGFDNIYLVTRAYQTRHGQGPMTNESLVFDVKKDPLETNVDTGFQGQFRKTMLDVNLLQYAIQKDPYLRENKKRCVLVVTCLDHMKKFEYTWDGNIRYASNKCDFAAGVGGILGVGGLMVSDSPDSSDILVLEEAKR